LVKGFAARDMATFLSIIIEFISSAYMLLRELNPIKNSAPFVLLLTLCDRGSKAADNGSKTTTSGNREL
jgi:hypothetical protein